jgi:hypothetical protein
MVQELNEGLPDSERSRIETLANAGDLKSQIFLSWAFDHFGIFDYDEQAAEKWLRLAATSNDIDALRRLARFELVRNRPQAMETANILTSRKDFFGYYLLGNIFKDGSCGAEVNKSEAVRNFKNGSDQGHLPSKFGFLLNSASLPYLNPIVLVKLLGACLQFVWLYTFDTDNDRLYR